MDSRLVLSSHSFEIQLEMNQMSEFILFANVHCLWIRVILPFVKDAREPTFEFGLIVELKDAVVKESCQSFRKVIEAGMNWLVLLQFQIRIFVNCELVYKMWVLVLWLSNNGDQEGILSLMDLKSEPWHLVGALLLVERGGLDFHRPGRDLPWVEEAVFGALDDVCYPFSEVAQLDFLDLKYIVFYGLEVVSYGLIRIKDGIEIFINHVFLQSFLFEHRIALDQPSSLLSPLHIVLDAPETCGRNLWSYLHGCMVLTW